MSINLILTYSTLSAVMITEKRLNANKIFLSAISNKLTGYYFVIDLLFFKNNTMVALRR